MTRALPLQQAREAIYRLIKFRPRSVAEVRRKLQDKQFDARVIDDAVAWAFSSGLLDDAKFAQLWVHDRLLHRPSGRHNLRMELRQKGVSESDIDATLETLDHDERQLIRELVEQRLPRYQGESSEKRQRKLVAFLLRRGFGFNDVFAVLKAMKLTG